MLWDCIALLDEATEDVVRALGGLRAVAVSHPHYYTTMVEWARAFGCPVYLHAADREWVMRPDPALRFWEGESLGLDEVGVEGLTLVRCGGHFEGGAVLHWARGAEGRGALLTGDVVQVVPDRRWVSFMRSYPNLIPLDAGERRAHRRRRWSRSSTTASTAPGGTCTWSATPRPPSRAPPRATWPPSAGIRVRLTRRR